MDYDDEWVSLTQAAAFFAVSTKTMRHILTDAGTHVLHISPKRIRIKKTDLQALYDQRYMPLGK